jgi:hypothetical protein
MPDSERITRILQNLPKSWQTLFGVPLDIELTRTLLAEDILAKKRAFIVSYTRTLGPPELEELASRLGEAAESVKSAVPEVQDVPPRRGRPPKAA